MNDSRALTSQLSCLSMLEDKAAFLYKKLSEKTGNPLAKSLLLSIALDSSKHSALLKGISNSISVKDVETKDCAKSLGQVWSMVDTCLKELTKKEVGELFSKDLDEKLIALESIMGEEYYILVQMETMQHLTKEINQRYNVDLNNAKSVFENIINDENHHRETIIQLRKLIEPEQKDLDNTPLVKYQSPGHWIEYTPQESAT